MGRTEYGTVEAMGNSMNRIVTLWAAAFATLAPVSMAVAQAPRAAAPLPPYRVNAGDDLEIYVWGDERLQRTLKVLPDGSFAFPLAGTVRAIGRTPTEVEQELSKLLAPQYKGVPPQVTVSVRTATGMNVSVIGKVRTPGTFSPSRYINVLDALTLAGGPTEFADVSNVVILRRENGRMVSIRSRMGSVLKGRPSADDMSETGIPQLQSGDTVIVP